jgi:hypothetical protein
MRFTCCKIKCRNDVHQSIEDRGKKVDVERKRGGIASNQIQ